MDTRVEHSDELEAILAGLLRPLLDQELSIVFYDLTTLRLKGQSTVEGELRQYGMAKEGDIARQCLLGVVQTAEGLPIYHAVFAGNTAETTTLVPTIQGVLSRFPIRRVIVVADRGLLSLDNLAELQQIRIREQALEFILAVLRRRYSEFTALLQDFHTQQCAAAADEITGELPWQGFRLVVAHHPEVAAERTAARDQQIATLEQQAKVWAGKLDGQDTGTRYRGRKLSDGGVMARFHRAVSEAKLSRILRVDLSSPLCTFAIDESALTRARMMDGKLLLVTNVQDITPEEIVARYKALADIERGFRVMKSEIEIAPIFHRLPDRIRAHAPICFLALISTGYCGWLKARHSPHSPERAGNHPSIQLHQITFQQRQQASGLTHLTLEQQELFADLELPKSTSGALQATL